MINKCIENIESDGELKENDTKNCSSYYFDDISEMEDFNLIKF